MLLPHETCFQWNDMKVVCQTQIKQEGWGWWVGGNGHGPMREGHPHSDAVYDEALPHADG